MRGLPNILCTHGDDVVPIQKAMNFIENGGVDELAYESPTKKVNILSAINRKGTIFAHFPVNIGSGLGLGYCPFPATDVTTLSLANGTPLPCDGIMRNFSVRSHANTLNRATTFSIYKNTAETPLAVTLGIGELYAINNTTTVSYSAGDQIIIVWQLAFGTGLTPTPFFSLDV